MADTFNRLRRSGVRVPLPPPHSPPKNQCGSASFRWRPKSPQDQPFSGGAAYWFKRPRSAGMNVCVGLAHSSGSSIQHSAWAAPCNAKRQSRVGDRLDEMVAALRSKIDRGMADIRAVAPRHISLTPFSCRLIASGADVIIATPGRMLGGSPRRNGLTVSILASDILNIWKCVCGNGLVTTLPELSLPTYQCCYEHGG